MSVRPRELNLNLKVSPAFSPTSVQRLERSLALSEGTKPAEIIH